MSQRIIASSRIRWFFLCWYLRGTYSKVIKNLSVFRRDRFGFFLSQRAYPCGEVIFVIMVLIRGVIECIIRKLDESQEVLSFFLFPPPFAEFFYLFCELQSKRGECILWFVFFYDSLSCELCETICEDLRIRISCMFSDACKRMMTTLYSI